MTAPAVPSDPELGYFGPGSATWQVMADPAAGAGGLAALFMQALHPRAMAGVDQHSDFDSDFWPRLGRTAEYVMTVTFSPATGWTRSRRRSAPGTSTSGESTR